METRLANLESYVTGIFRNPVLIFSFLTQYYSVFFSYTGTNIPNKMKNSILLFSIKCSVILYFAACTGIDQYTTAISATPQVIKGTWKVTLFTKATNDETTEFAGYCLTFEPTGKIIASKNGKQVTGNWAEDEILKRITINLDTKDPSLAKLNDYWTISNISKSGLSFESAENTSTERLQITSL